MRARRSIIVTAALFAVACSADSDKKEPDSSDDAAQVQDTAVSDSKAADATADSVSAGADAADATSAASDSAVSDSAGSGLETTDSAGGEVADSVQADTTAGPWHSKLFNAAGQLQDGPNGERLIDYSYAGYRNSNVPLPAQGSVTVDVGKTADPTGNKDSTAAIQAAIDAVAKAKGGVVFIPAGLYRLDGVLTISASGTVIRGAGPTKTRLYFTRHKNMAHKAHITFAGKLKYTATMTAHVAPGGPKPVFHMGTFFNNASGFSKGDDVAIGITITKGFIADHKMAGTWKAFNDTWQPFFWRTIKTIKPSWHGSHGVKWATPIPYRFKHRDGPTAKKVTGYLAECGLEDLAIANAVDWDAAWANNQVHAVNFIAVKDCWVWRVHSFDGPGPAKEGLHKGAHLQSSGIMVKLSKRVSVVDCKLAKSQNRGGGGNGYLFEVRQSSHILTKNCVADGGRHNFIQNWGFGTSGCVWTGVTSKNGQAWFSKSIAIAPVGLSEFHHSLAMFNLVDDSVFDDGWASKNRGQYSTGAGHTAHENAIWNARGKGIVLSYNFGRGYVVGTGPKLSVATKLSDPGAKFTEPEDWTEGVGKAATLQPQSLFSAQLKKRVNKP